MSADQSQIHLAFRFHVNLYHSYRGDSLDDRGIGKDLRIIRMLLDQLDSLNAEGIPVRGAWDIENYYSLQLYLPRHAPDIIERIRGRVAAGLDEVELMSWNNGLLTAHTRDEFEDSISRAIANPEGSGLADLFGEWAPVVRPQECMFSSSQIAAYRRLGVEAVSVYYSSAPFNGFGSFVAPLGLAQRHNPLALRDEASGAEMRLIPAYSPADVVERWGSLRRWLRAMRREQLAAAEPVDLLLLLDMDADDSFWEGFLPSFLAPLLPSLAGFERMVRSVAGLPWLRFCRPWDYARSHGDAGRISLGQDLADGSFDGYSSWSEKAENASLWPLIAQARRDALLADRLAVERATGGVPGFEEAASAARTAILRSLSTTHFGMAAPVMNAARLADAFARAGEALAAAGEALALARGPGPGAAAGHEGGALYFDPRIDALPRGEGALVTLPQGETGAPASSQAMVLFAANPLASREARLSSSPVGALRVEKDSIHSGSLALSLAEGGGVMLHVDGQAAFEAPLSRPWVRHAGRIRGAARGRHSEEGASLRLLVPDRMAELAISGSFELERGARVVWRHRFTLAAGLSSLRVDVEIDYPATRHLRFDRAKARRLGRDWDGRWSEVAPFELVPVLGARADRPARVWKHGFDDCVGHYDLDYHRLGPNRDLASFDNHCTDGWVAVTGPAGGLLLAQADTGATLFAFCPMRLVFEGERQLVKLNPFGSYYGAQWRYPTAVTGLGRLAALATGDNFDPYAPSWEGGSLRFSLMIAPFAGQSPPPALQRDALIFSSSPRRALALGLGL